tara:strand:- start:604 stop:1158 length:555 start_codon:yes stop_codon:yes gene_type:complete
MTSIPTLNTNVAARLESCEERSNDALLLARMARAAAINIQNVNNKNSGYIKNLNLIIKTLSKISDSVNLYRAERGVVDFTIQTNGVNHNNINNVGNQLQAINGILQSFGIDLINLKSVSSSANDASASKFADTLDAINTQLLYMTAAMIQQISISSSAFSIVGFQEIIADNDGIKYLDDLPSYE